MAKTKRDPNADWHRYCITANNTVKGAMDTILIHERLWIAAGVLVGASGGILGMIACGFIGWLMCRTLIWAMS